MIIQVGMTLLFSIGAAGGTIYGMTNDVDRIAAAGFTALLVLPAIILYALLDGGRTKFKHVLFFLGFGGVTGWYLYKMGIFIGDTKPTKEFFALAAGGGAAWVFLLITRGLFRQKLPPKEA
jgi:hypothetical protein